MATITPTIKDIKKNVKLITWVGRNADTFLPHKLIGNTATDITVQSIAGTCSVKGTLDSSGSNLSKLSDYNGSLLDLIDGQISEVAERPLFIAPDTIVSTVVNTDVTIHLVIWR